jgi:hypothetical protein
MSLSFRITILRSLFVFLMITSFQKNESSARFVKEANLPDENSLLEWLQVNHSLENILDSYPNFLNKNTVLLNRLINLMMKSKLVKKIQTPLKWGKRSPDWNEEKPNGDLGDLDEFNKLSKAEIDTDRNAELKGFDEFVSKNTEISIADNQSHQKNNM